MGKMAGGWLVRRLQSAVQSEGATSSWDVAINRRREPHPSKVHHLSEIPLLGALMD